MDIETEIILSKFRRWASAVPSSDFISTISSSAALMAVVAAVLSAPSTAHPMLIPALIFLVFCMGLLLLFFIVGLVIKTWAEYQSKTHDTALIGEMEAKFDSMLEVRTIAARRCLEYFQKKSWDKVNKADDVEDILDFFDVMGASVRNNLISDEVAHQYFYVYLRIYYHALKDYMPFGRDKYGQTTWEHIEPLFLRLFMVEKHKALSYGEMVEQEPIESQLVAFLRTEGALDIEFLKPFNSKTMLVLRVTNRGSKMETITNAFIYSFKEGEVLQQWGVDLVAPIAVPPANSAEVHFSQAVGTFQAYGLKTFFGVVVLADGTTLTTDRETTPILVTKVVST